MCKEEKVAGGEITGSNYICEEGRVNETKAAICIARLWRIYRVL